MHRALGANFVAGSVVAANGTVPITKYIGRACNGLGVLNNAVTIKPAGTYSITGFVTMTDTAAGNVAIQLYENGVAIANTVASVAVAAIGDSFVLPIDYMIYKAPGCPCSVSLDSISIVVTEGGGTVTGGAINVKTV